MCICAKLTLTFAGAEHHVNMQSNATISCLFLGTLFLFLGAPQFAYERQASHSELAFTHGNCTDLRTIDVEAQRDMIESCPNFDYLFIHKIITFNRMHVKEICFFL